MKKAKAFAPGNISCTFVIKRNKNPKKTGSLGLGFTVNQGVTVTARISNTKAKNNLIIFNNRKIKFPTVDSLIKKLTKEKINVEIKTKLPLGSGFGISGASALATSYSINKLLGLKKTKKELAILSHVAEVENGTGLGDVTNQYFGGFLVKYEPSYNFKVKKIPIKNKTIFYKCFGKINTKKIISNKKIENKINDAGVNSLKEIKKTKKTLKNLILISKKFALFSGLMKKELFKEMVDIEAVHGTASMIMLGNSIFADKKFKGSKKLIIIDKGAYVL